jgi:SAM-dependent methyltransferase
MDERLATNRENWNDRTAVHLDSAFYDVEGWLRDRRQPRAREVEALGDVTGLRLLHLQCHFGLDTLAWARAGAHVTGLDFSPTAIDAARDIARRAGLSDRAEFVCSDVYDATSALEHSTFDIVYVDAARPLTATRSYEWNHGIGEMVTALIHHGLRLEWLVEHDWTVWARFPWLIENGDGTWSAPPGMPRSPYTFSLLASRVSSPVQ